MRLTLTPSLTQSPTHMALRLYLRLSSSRRNRVASIATMLYSEGTVSEYVSDQVTEYVSV